MSNLDPKEVSRRLSVALDLSARKWVPGHENDPLALGRVHDQLRSALIPPSLGTVIVEPAFVNIVGAFAGPVQVWFLTGDQRQRLFYDERTEKFGIGWGPEAATGAYIDIGIRTADPIDAFLA